MEPADRYYFLKRAEEELELGEAATTKQAADAHFELAGRYFDLAYRGFPSQQDCSIAAPETVTVRLETSLTSG